MDNHHQPATQTAGPSFFGSAFNGPAAGLMRLPPLPGPRPGDPPGFNPERRRVSITDPSLHAVSSSSRNNSRRPSLDHDGLNANAAAAATAGAINPNDGLDARRPSTAVAAAEGYTFPPPAFYADQHPRPHTATHLSSWGGEGQQYAQGWGDLGASPTQAHSSHRRPSTAPRPPSSIPGSSLPSIADASPTGSPSQLHPSGPGQQPPPFHSWSFTNAGADPHSVASGRRMSGLPLVHEYAASRGGQPSFTNLSLDSRRESYASSNWAPDDRRESGASSFGFRNPSFSSYGGAPSVIGGSSGTATGAGPGAGDGGTSTRMTSPGEEYQSRYSIPVAYQATAHRYSVPQPGPAGWDGQLAPYEEGFRRASMPAHVGSSSSSSHHHPHPQPNGSSFVDMAARPPGPTFEAAATVLGPEVTMQHPMPDVRRPSGGQDPSSLGLSMPTLSSHPHHQHPHTGKAPPSNSILERVKAEAPYSRSPELRVSHKLAERKRRREMKDLFDELRDLLPHDRSMKSSKWEILSRAVDYVSQQKVEMEALARENDLFRHQCGLGPRASAFPGASSVPSNPTAAGPVPMVTTPTVPPSTNGVAPPAASSWGPDHHQHQGYSYPHPHSHQPPGQGPGQTGSLSPGQYQMLSPHSHSHSHSHSLSGGGGSVAGGAGVERPASVHSQASSTFVGQHQQHQQQQPSPGPGSTDLPPASTAMAGLEPGAHPQPIAT